MVKRAVNDGFIKSRRGHGQTNSQRSFTESKRARRHVHVVVVHEPPALVQVRGHEERRQHLQHLRMVLLRGHVGQRPGAPVGLRDGGCGVCSVAQEDPERRGLVVARRVPRLLCVWMCGCVNLN